MKKILIMGLPGSGKTTLSEKITLNLKALGYNVDLHNADEIRKKHNDWDFSTHGRLTQANRMALEAHSSLKNNHIAICDFICPTLATRELFHGDRHADIVVWMDTISQGRFEDTNKIFEPPTHWDFRICEFDSDKWSRILTDYITGGKRLHKWDNKAPTVQMLGRWQPWHDGHQELFKQALTRAEQVCIMIRDTQGTDEKNPYHYDVVEQNIHNALQVDYAGRYQVLRVPNITNIVYGRDVGYKIEKIDLPPEIEAISATNIRNASR